MLRFCDNLFSILNCVLWSTCKIIEIKRNFNKNISRLWSAHAWSLRTVRCWAIYRHSDVPVRVPQIQSCATYGVFFCEDFGENWLLYNGTTLYMELSFEGFKSTHMTSFVGFSEFLSHFYPRPVLASGYCRCLCLSVHPSVRQSVHHPVCLRHNSSPVQARITKFGP